MKSWSLYNREEKLRIDDLSMEQVKIILLAISTRRMHEWYACQSGDLSWKPLSEVSEYSQDVAAIKDETAPIQMAAGAEHSITQRIGQTQTLTKTRPKKEKTKSKAKIKVEAPPQTGANHVIDGAGILTIHDLIVDKAQTKERRSARRYARKLSFQVSKEGHNFVSQTVDISMNGLSLTTPLPAWVPRSFSATLKLNQYSLNIQCEKVSEKKLKIVAAESWDLIRQWIVNW